MQREQLSAATHDPLNWFHTSVARPLSIPHLPKPPFLATNPLHTPPTLITSGFIYRLLLPEFGIPRIVFELISCEIGSPASVFRHFFPAVLKERGRTFGEGIRCRID